MVPHRSDAELKKILSGLQIICDTREQDTHCEDYFRAHKVPVIVRKLDAGDYSAQLDGLSMERDVVIERKGDLDELCGNLTVDRDRFEREFIRAKAYGTRVYLVIENATWSDVFLGNYRSKFAKSSLLASLCSWMARYGVTVIFCKPTETPKIIYQILYYAARNELLYGRQ